jgi:hypothetical protein
MDAELFLHRNERTQRVSELGQKRTLWQLTIDFRFTLKS